MLVHTPRTIIIESPDEENPQENQSYPLNQIQNARPSFITVTKSTKNNFQPKNSTLILDHSSKMLTLSQNHNQTTLSQLNDYTPSRISHAKYHFENNSLKNITISQYDDNTKSPMNLSQFRFISNAINKEEINYKEAFNYYSSLFFTQESFEIKRKRKLNCCKFLINKLYNKSNLRSDLKIEEEFIRFLSQMKFSDKLETQKRVITTINNFFMARTEDKTKAVDAKLIIKIQKNDYCFVYSMILLLSLIEKFPEFAISILRQFEDKSLVIELTLELAKLCVSFIRLEEFIIYFNQKKSVTFALNLIFIGMLYVFYFELQKEKPLIKDESELQGVVKEVEIITKRDVSRLLWKIELLKERYDEKKNSMSFSNFSKE